MTRGRRCMCGFLRSGDPTEHVKLYNRACSKPAGHPPRWPDGYRCCAAPTSSSAAKGLISWETAQDTAAIKAPSVQ